MRISDWSSDVCSSDLALQATVVETLDAEAQAVHAGGAITFEAAVLGGAGIGLQGDLATRGEAQAAAGLLQEGVDRLGREQRWRAAAGEHRQHRAPQGQRQVVVEVGDQDRKSTRMNSSH